MEKRGLEYQLFFLMELIAAFLVSALLIYVAISYAKGSAVTKSYIAIDQALLIDTLNSFKGNVLAVYPIPKEGYYYTIDSNTVKVTDISLLDRDPTKGIFQYVPTSTQDLNYESKNPEKIIFAKSGNDIIITNSLNHNIKSLSCSGTPISISTIIIDPGHGTSQGFAVPDEQLDTGFVNKELGLAESNITRNIAESLFFLDDSLSFTRNVRFEEYKSLNERTDAIESSHADALISIHVGSEDNPNVNHVKAYISVNSKKKRESEQLGCIIINELIANFPEITGGLVVPVNVSELDADNPMRVLDSKDISVLLEIGNINSINNNILTKHARIAKSILNAVKRYNR